MTEDQLLATVIGLARWHGWRSAHFRPAKTQSGRWATAVQGDGKGFPDLVLVHGPAGRLVFAELKAEDGRYGPGQREWLADLTAVADGVGELCGTGIGPDESPVEVHTWRPADLDAGRIDAVLRVSPADRAAALR